MSKKRRKPKRRARPGAAASRPPPPKRRIPAPQMPPQQKPSQPQHPWPDQTDENPYVSQIVTQLKQVSTTSGISRFVLISDWLGMMEASLRMWAENMKAMATTGHFVEDPPEIKAIFAQARARYLRAAEQYPAAYRQMQQAFSQSFALLIESAGPGLARYAEQTEFSPDVIGQVFMRAVEPGWIWSQYFPPWPLALKRARAALPDGSQLVYHRLAIAALKARAAGQSIELEPGENFDGWLEAIHPYVEPVIIGPPLIDSSPMMLAAAAQFAPWQVERKLVEFYGSDQIDPLLARMVRLNGMLYNLNGYLLEHLQAGAEIEAYLKQQEADPDRTVSPVDLFRPEEPAPARPAPQAGRSFADLFRTEPDERNTG